MKNISALTQRKQYETPRVRTLPLEPVSQWILARNKKELFKTLRKSDAEQREIAVKLLGKNTRKASTGKIDVFVRNVSQEELRIIELLNRRGIATEQPFSFELVTRDPLGICWVAPMGFLSSGTALVDVFNEYTFDRISALRMLENIVVKMHLAGVEHGHLTFRNLFWKDEQLVLGDFSLARRRTVDWNSAKSIIENFKRDYCSIIRRAEEHLRDIDFWRSFFTNIIFRYPASEVKMKVIKKIEKEIDCYWRESESILYCGIG